MSPLLLSALLGSALALPYAFAEWLIWQSRKDRTAVPVGAWTSRYGRWAGAALQLVCLSGVFLLWLLFEWRFVAALLVVWLGGRWLAANLERQIYATALTIEQLVEAFEEAGRLENLWMALGQGKAVPKDLPGPVGELLPLWWLRLMPSAWRRALAARVEAARRPLTAGQGSLE